MVLGTSGLGAVITGVHVGGAMYGVRVGGDMEFVMGEVVVELAIVATFVSRERIEKFILILTIESVVKE